MPKPAYVKRILRNGNRATGLALIETQDNRLLSALCTPKVLEQLKLGHPARLSLQATTLGKHLVALRS